MMENDELHVIYKKKPIIFYLHASVHITHAYPLNIDRKLISLAVLVVT